jgi:hypothetical protein
LSLVLLCLPHTHLTSPTEPHSLTHTCPSISSSPNLLHSRLIPSPLSLQPPNQLQQPSMSVKDPRLSQILPVIRCSDCGHDVEFRLLGEHVCSSAPPMPALPVIPVSKCKPSTTADCLVLPTVHYCFFLSFCLLVSHTHIDHPGKEVKWEGQKEKQKKKKKKEWGRRYGEKWLYFSSTTLFFFGSTRTTATCSQIGRKGRLSIVR